MSQANSKLAGILIWRMLVMIAFVATYIHLERVVSEVHQIRTETRSEARKLYLDVELNSKRIDEIEEATDEVYLKVEDLIYVLKAK